MVQQTRKSLGFAKPLLALLSSLLALVILLYGLSRSMKAESKEPSLRTSTEGNYPSLLDYQTGVSTVCEQTKPLVPNWRFEDGICSGPGRCCNHWCCGTEGACTCEESLGYNSGTSVAIFADGVLTEAFALYTPTWDFFPVEPGRVYDYSAWIKTVLSPGSAYLRFTFWSSSGEPIGEDYKSVAVTNTQETWVKVTGSKQVPLGAVSARVECVVSPSSRGWAWFDDIFWGLATCLQISKGSDPASVEPGQVLTYTIVYSNTGRETATSVTIIETYDDYVDFESAQPPPLTGTTTIWMPPDLSAGASNTITVVVKIEDDTGERASLRNGVQILSNETVEPVYTTITTSVDGNGCDIALYVPGSERQGKPGYPTDYAMTVHNMGKCDGQIVVTATSSQGWDVNITPQSSCNLPALAAKEMTISPVVPQCELSGTVDVTFITTTLVCDSPCSKAVTKTQLLTTTVMRQVEVDIEPDTSKPPPASGPTVIFTHTVTNTGNLTDTFTLTHDFPDDFTVTINPSTQLEDLGPCESKPITVTVGNLASDTEVTGTIRAACMSDPSEFDEVIDEIKLWRSFLPLVMKKFMVYFEGPGEVEPNNSCGEANGPLRSSKDYHGYPNDTKDYFSIYLRTGGAITIDLTNHTGRDVQLQLHDQSCGCIKYDYTPPYRIDHNGTEGWYYIYIYTGSGHNDTISYTLRTTFP